MAPKTIWAPMPNSKRAKQFQPFDALVGLREAIAVREQIPVTQKELTEDAIMEINEKLHALEKGQIVIVEYYGLYEQNYLQLTGPVTQVDTYFKNLQIGNVVISFSEIYDLVIG